MKREICVDARMIFHAGIGTYLRNLLLQLKHSTYKIRAIVPKWALDKAPWLADLDPIFCSAPIYSLEEQVKLPLLIPKCDLFWTPHFNIPLSPLRAKKRLVTIHDAFHFAFYSQLKPLEKLYAKVVFSTAVKRSDQIITISRFSKGEIIKYVQVDPNKINCISLGIDRSLFREDLPPSLIDKVKKKYQLPHDFFLFVGSLKPHKNVKGLIQAFDQLSKKEFRHLHLLVVGKKSGFHHGEEVSALMQIAPSLKEQIRFLGAVEDEELPVFYKLAKLSAQPSFYEGFGLPPLEAMSCGCPTVVSNAASLPEVCGEASIFVHPDDPLDIARGLEVVLKYPNLREDLKLKGLKKSKEFDWKKTSEQHLNVIERMLK